MHLSLCMRINRACTENMHNLESLSQPRFVEKDAQLLADELRETFGKNKTFLPGFELPALTALSFYPELIDVNIEFRFVKSNTPLSTRPKYSTILKPAKERTYVVYITNKIRKGREDILPENLSFNVLTGLFAHEFSHICDYLHKSSFEAIAIALKYPLKPYKKILERKIDLLTVAHGMGNQLMEFGQMITNLRKRQPKDGYYKTYFDYYLRPDEIQRILTMRAERSNGHPLGSDPRHTHQKGRRANQWE